MTKAKFNTDLVSTALQISVQMLKKDFVLLPPEAKSRRHYPTESSYKSVQGTGMHGSMSRSLQKQTTSLQSVLL